MASLPLVAFPTLMTAAVMEPMWQASWGVSLMGLQRTLPFMLVWYDNLASALTLNTSMLFQQQECPD